MSAWLTPEEEKVFLFTVLSGSEDGPMSDADRMALVKWRISQMGNQAQSIGDKSQSAVDAIAAGGGGGVSEARVREIVAGSFEAGEAAANA